MRPSRLVLLPALLSSLLLSGCNLSQFSAPSAAPSILPAITGSVHGGQQPVSGAVIQLYSTNTTTTQGASTPLIGAPVLTRADGTFTITGTYTCPSPAALVYIVATGGNPGLGGTVNSAAIAEMTVLGTCGSLTASTFISINELTTVAAVEALAPFMLDYAHVGAATVSSLTTAFANAVVYVDPVTGQFRSNLPIGVTAPTTLLNTLADILAACVNTSGSTATGMPCATLFQYTSGASGNIILALLYIINHPTLNVAQLFTLIVPNSPFLPVLTVAPTSWALPTLYNLGLTYEHAFDQLLADTQGHIWLLQPYAGMLTQYDTSLNLLHSYNVGSIATGGTALHMTLDPSDNLWVPLGAALLKIAPDGSLRSPAAGYPIDQTSLAAYTSFNFTSDSAGNIWGSVIRVSDYAVCAVEYSPSGTLLSPASGFCSSLILGSNSPVPTQIVADSSGNVYLMTFGSVASPILKFNAAGTVTIIPTNTYYSGVSGYYTAVYDPGYQHIWASDTAVLDNLRLDGTVNFSTYGSSYVYGVIAPFLNGMAVDGGGDLWVASVYGTLVEVSPTGAVLSGCTASYLCGIPVVAQNVGRLAGVAVDPAGDVFTVDVTDGVLLKYTGIAAPR